MWRTRRGLGPLDARRNRPARLRRAATPSETLNNIVHLIQRRFETDVCSVYLLEPDRANLVLAATVGLRAESVGRVRMRLTEGLAGLVAEQLRPQVVADAADASALQVLSARPARIRTARSSACRSSIAGCCRACSSSRRSTPRTFGADDVRLLTMAGRAAGADRRAKRARSDSSSRRRISGSARWRRTSGGAGTPTRRASSASSIRCSGASSTTIRSRCCSRSRSTQLEERASQLALHSRINYAYRRLQEYLHSKHTWGARHAGVLWARPVAYFSAEFGLHESLPIYSGGLGILAGDHIKSASDLGIPLVGVGLYYDQGYFRQRLDRDGWQHEDYIDVDHRSLPMRPALASGVPVTDLDRDADRARSPRASGSSRSAATRCSCSTRTSRATSPRIAS